MKFSVCEKYNKHLKLRSNFLLLAAGSHDIFFHTRTIVSAGTQTMKNFQSPIHSRSITTFTILVAMPGGWTTQKAEPGCFCCSTADDETMNTVDG
jgi:hypothetical protein